MTRTPTDYSKSMIYKLCCKDPTIEDIYVGSTTHFTKRKAEHKKCCIFENNKRYNLLVYKFIRDNGGFNNWDMIKIKDYPTDSKRNLEMEERRVIEELKPTLNKNIPYRTIDERKVYLKEYRQKNKEILRNYHKDYQQNNREMIEEKQKEKVSCDKCGAIVRKDGLKRHQRGKKCINYN